MGKATENERLKLKAAFFNNLAVGLLLTGFLIPYLTITRDLDEIARRLVNWQSITAGEARTVIANVVALFMAYTASRAARRHADSIVADIKEDDVEPPRANLVVPNLTTPAVDANEAPE